MPIGPAVGLGAVAGVAALVATTLTAPNVQGVGSENAVHVCVGTDRVVRLARSAVCDPGEESIYLAKAGEDADVADEDLAECEKQAARLEKRLKALELMGNKRQMTGVVVAPFEVVDDHGNRIFYVNDGTVSVYHPSSSQATAVVRADESGGAFVGTSSTGDLQTFLGAGRYDRAGLIISQGGVERVQFGRQATGNYSAKFLGAVGQTLAGVGETQEGGGGALVADASGVTRAMMLIDGEQHGLIAVFNPASVAIAALTEGRTGGGLLTIGSSTGERMVAAGVQAGGFGVVQTGPASFTTAAGLGLPGSYLMGKP